MREKLIPMHIIIIIIIIIIVYSKDKFQYLHYGFKKSKTAHLIFIYLKKKEIDFKMLVDLS